MIRLLLSLLFPRPSLRQRFAGYVTPRRHPGESVRAFRARQIDAVLARSEDADVHLFIG